MSPKESQPEFALQNCGDLLNTLYERCTQAAPNFGVGFDYFQTALDRAARKYLFAADAPPPTTEEIRQFLNELQINDLFLALACAAGNERAWWEFDQQHRAYLERVARHLASSDVNADEVVDSVYVELYGTRIVDGVRQSKFATYTGRGSIRGWLRTIVWHALVDLHRASHDELSLDELTENVGEGHAQAAFLNQSSGGELDMHDHLARERYRNATVAALKTSFGALDDHEKLLLLYYHVENLKLREISRLVEVPESPLRRWFQRKSERREHTPEAKVHESTVMRWLEKVYAKVLQNFRMELKQTHALKESEVEMCLGLALEDISPSNIQHQISLT